MKAAGISLIGILLGIGAGMILVVGTALLATRGFNISREHTEQVRITEDVRIQMERMSDAIRDARSLDLTGDGLATLQPEFWLQYGDAYDIQFYTNFDEDDETERLHYFLEGTELKFGIRDPYNAPEEKVTVVAKSLRNRAQAEPLFRYSAGLGGGPIPSPGFGTENVQEVEITLVVDVNETQAPTAAKVSTVVVPRASRVVYVSPSPSPEAGSSCPVEGVPPVTLRVNLAEGNPGSDQATLGGDPNCRYTLRFTWTARAEGSHLAELEGVRCTQADPAAGVVALECDSLPTGLGPHTLDMNSEADPNDEYVPVTNAVRGGSAIPLEYQLDGVSPIHHDSFLETVGTPISGSYQPP